MSEPATQRMNIAQFLAWQPTQAEPFELVDGQPRAMTGARIRHDRITANLLRLLGTQFRANSNPCDAFTDDIAVIVPVGSVRRADVIVLCPPIDELATASDRPRLVAEVLSASTETIDRLVKLDEYKAIPGLDYIVFLAADVLEIGLWQRDPAGLWEHAVIRDPGAVVALPRLGLTLAAADIYDRVTLREPPGPRLVWPASSPSA